MKWKHKTMNNEIADELVTKGNQRLLRNGICLGTECSFPTFMGLSLSMQESMQMMQDMDLVGQDHRRDAVDYRNAKSRVRDIVLDRFPAAIAKDQRMWEAATL